MRYEAWDEVIELGDADILEIVDDGTAMMEAWFAVGERQEVEGWIQSYDDEFTVNESDDASFLARARERVSILFPVLPRAAAG